MIRFYNILLLILVLNSSEGLEDLREKYFEIDTIEQADLFIYTLKEDFSIEAIGYTAALNFTKSKLYKFPLKKLKYFKRGKSMLDDVINDNPENLELRYLRYCIQKNVPEFLNYNNHIIEDLSLIKNEIVNSSILANIKSTILTNIISLNELSENDKFELENILNKL